MSVVAARTPGDDPDADRFEPAPEEATDDRSQQLPDRSHDRTTRQ